MTGESIRHVSLIAKINHLIKKFVIENLWQSVQLTTKMITKQQAKGVLVCEKMASCVVYLHNNTFVCQRNGSISAQFVIMKMNVLMIFPTKVMSHFVLVRNLTEI